MKASYYLCLLISLGCLLSSCDQEIDINDDWSDVGVVYALLDADKKVNWVRIERGYLGTEPASASFSIPDSLYYDSLYVLLNGMDENGIIQDSRRLVKDQSKNLDSGLFTTEDFRLYRNNDDQRLDEDLIYQLRVIKIDTTIKRPPLWTDQQVDSAILAGYFSRFDDTRAETELVSPRNRTNPNTGFRFMSPNPNQTPPRYNGQIRWFKSENAELYEIDLWFYYRELDTTTGITVEKEFKSDFESQTGPFSTGASGIIESNKGRTQLYEAIAANVPVDDNVLRFYDRMEIKIYAGGEQLRRFIQLNEPTSSLSQTRPEFTQVQNGTGLFSSRTDRIITDVQLSEGTNGVKNTFYLDPILCDRNFVNLEFSDTCYCEFFAGAPSKQCF